MILFINCTNNHNVKASYEIFTDKSQNILSKNAPCSMPQAITLFCGLAVVQSCGLFFPVPRTFFDCLVPVACRPYYIVVQSCSRAVMRSCGCTARTCITAEPAELHNFFSHQLSVFCPVPCALSCSIPGGTTTLNRKSRKIINLRDFVFQGVMPASILIFNHESAYTML
jgi:hypothetical protein